ncbi:hypothetical protein ACFW9F_01410 [Streptomyces sp. NPDC059506]|uniref:hypothetical protein n=1 Tax=Streptomyces sp. NPDC059506 TaxID=3347751 RepID=UPI0036B450AF
MPSTRPDFSGDPAAQAIYDYLAPHSQGAGPLPGGRLERAAAIAEREGLDLAADIRRLPSRRPAPDRPRRQDHGWILQALQAAEPRYRGGRHRGGRRARAVAAAWALLGLGRSEWARWTQAVGLWEPARAEACLRAGLTVDSLEVVVDGRQIRRRLRGGESPDAVIARAAATGVDLGRRSR